MLYFTSQLTKQMQYLESDTLMDHILMSLLEKHL